MRRLLFDARRLLRAPSRTPRMAVVVGRLLGSAFVICFATGLYSHFLQDPLPWMHLPTWPLNLYQLTQGIHVTAGIACLPLLLGKLYVVYPALFRYPPVKSLPQLLERASIALFVAASIVQIVIGLLDTVQWYPFPFNFRQTHFALSFVVVGSLAVHIAVKLPIIARHWTRARSIDAVDEDEAADVAPPPISGLTGRIIDWIDSAPPPEPGISRRGFLATITVATGGLVAFTAGQSFALLDPIDLVAPRKPGIGPAGLPINRTARAARVTEAMVGDDWSLRVSRGDISVAYSRAELAGMQQHEVLLPIACVEGWSQQASWRGVRLRDLVDAVGAGPDQRLRATSLEVRGGYRVMEMGPEFVRHDLTLVALELNGDRLDIDHGYPARIIAPNRPGVLQTKWLSALEVI